MLGGMPSKGVAGLANAPVNTTPLENTSGAAANGGYLNEEKDAKVKSTDAKFGDVLQNIQAKYGAKPEKPREIKKTLGKDDFLRIMISQMQHQDPTKPFDAQQMAQQMAQYASVEQLSNVNQNLVKMQNQTSGTDRMAMTGMIGKTVTVDRERFPHVEGTSESLTFALPKDASEVKIAVVSETGEPILEKDLGPLKAGENTFSWDGVKSNTLMAKGGSFMFRVAAKDARGMSIQTNPQSSARVIGVSFEGAEPVFLIGDARHQDKITMKNIVRIEDSSAVAPPQGMGQAMPKAGSPAMIAFEKGAGSKNLNAGEADPEASAAIAKYQEDLKANAAGEAKQAQVRKAFGAEDTAEADAAKQAMAAKMAALGEEPEAKPINPMSRNPQMNAARLQAAISGVGGFPSGLGESEAASAPSAPAAPSVSNNSGSTAGIEPKGGDSK